MRKKKTDKELEKKCLRSPDSYHVSIYQTHKQLLPHYTIHCWLTFNHDAQKFGTFQFLIVPDLAHGFARSGCVKIEKCIKFQRTTTQSP